LITAPRKRGSSIVAGVAGRRQRRFSQKARVGQERTAGRTHHCVFAEAIHREAGQFVAFGVDQAVGGFCREADRAPQVEAAIETLGKKLGVETAYGFEDNTWMTPFSGSAIPLATRSPCGSTSLTCRPARTRWRRAVRRVEAPERQRAA